MKRGRSLSPLEGKSEAIVHKSSAGALFDSEGNDGRWGARRVDLLGNAK